MRLAISVTADDIEAGNDQPAFCPVALAGTRALREAGFAGHRASWEPYRAFCEPAGFVVTDVARKAIFAVPVEQVDCKAYHFASLFDDWYRLEEGDPDKPDCPTPFEFEIELVAAPGG